MYQSAVCVISDLLDDRKNEGADVCLDSVVSVEIALVLVLKSLERRGIALFCIMC